jgi:hypothetical protein
LCSDGIELLEGAGRPEDGAEDSGERPGRVETGAIPSIVRTDAGAAAPVSLGIPSSVRFETEPEAGGKPGSAVILTGPA